MEELREDTDLKENVCPKVSVIIPVYNTEAYLAECLDSVLGQTFREIEVLCVNDGSTDESLKILQEYAAKDSRVRIFTKENGGQSSARNRGVKEASGEYIYFMDSDDILEQDALRLLYSCAADHDLDQLFCGTEVFFESEDLIGENERFLTYYERKGEYPDTESGRDMFLHQREYHDFKVAPWLQLLRRSFLTENNITFYEGIIHEDELYTMQCISLAKRVRVLDEALTRHRMRPGSTMTSEKEFKNVYGYFVCVREMLAFLEQHKIGEDVEFHLSMLDRLYGLCGLALKVLRSLEEEEVMQYVSAMDVRERTDFMMLVWYRFRRETDAERKLHREVGKIKNSRSYKLGRKLTAPVRLLRGK